MVAWSDVMSHDKFSMILHQLHCNTQIEEGRLRRQRQQADLIRDQQLEIERLRRQLSIAERNVAAVTIETNSVRIMIMKTEERFR